MKLKGGQILKIDNIDEIMKLEQWVLLFFQKPLSPRCLFAEIFTTVKNWKNWEFLSNLRVNSNKEALTLRTWHFALLNNLVK